MTLPLEALRIAPVRFLAPSETRKAASRAVSATVGRRLRRVLCSNIEMTYSLEIESLCTAFSTDCWMVLVSTIAPERMPTTLTPAGPRSVARHLKSDSMAPKADPMAVAFAKPRTGIAVTNRITPECCCTMCRAAARAVMNCEGTRVVNGNMNCSRGSSRVLVELP